LFHVQRGIETSEQATGPWTRAVQVLEKRDVLFQVFVLSTNILERIAYGSHPSFMEEAENAFGGFG